MKALLLSVPLWIGFLGCGSNHDVAGYLQSSATASSLGEEPLASGGSSNDSSSNSDDDSTDGDAVDANNGGSSSVDSDDSAGDTSADSDVSTASEITDFGVVEPEPLVDFVPSVPLEPAEPSTEVFPEAPELAPSTSSTVPFEEGFPGDGSPPEGFPGGSPPGEPVLWISGWPLDATVSVVGVAWPLPFSLDDFFGEPPLEPGYQRGMWVRGYDSGVLASWWYNVTQDPTLLPGVLTDVDGQRFVVTVDLSGDAYMVSADLPPAGTQPLLPIPEGL